MRKGKTVLQIIILVTGILIILPACNGKNVKMTDKNELLKVQVQKMCNLMEKGKFRQTRFFFIPQIQNIPEGGWKEHISHHPDAEGLVTFYKFKEINFREDGIAQVLIYSSLLKDKAITYDYWIFTKENWYMVDMGRTEPVSQDEIERYKKLIQNNGK